MTNLIDFNNTSILECWLQRRADNQVLSRKGCLIVVPVKGQKGLRLDSLGLVLWEMLGVPTTINRMVIALATRYEGEIKEITQDVEAFVYQILDQGLIEICTKPDPEEQQRLRYLSLLKKSLLNLLYGEHELRIQEIRTQPLPEDRMEKLRFFRDIRQKRPDLYDEFIASRHGAGISSNAPYMYSQTMIGMAALDNLQWCAQTVFSQKIPGDFLEAGVCRGGASIFMRALQLSYGENHRQMWVADSFQGLPKPQTQADLDTGMDWSDENMPQFTCSLDEVQEAFQRYGVLDDPVHFLQGWFPEPLQDTRIRSLAILRIDADMYESTLCVLNTLYKKVSPGGFVIVDDYGFLSECRKAVDEFREIHQIDSPITFINHSCIFWQVPIEMPSILEGKENMNEYKFNSILYGLNLQSNLPLPFTTKVHEDRPARSLDMILHYQGRISRPEIDHSTKLPQRTWSQIGPDGHWMLRFVNRLGDVLNMEYSCDGKRLHVSHSFSLQEDMYCAFWGAGMAAALHLQGKHLLHASAVSSEKGTILLTGASGIGKSTLTALLVKHGLELVADDLVVLESESTNIHAVLGHPFLKISSQTANFLKIPQDQLTPTLSYLFDSGEYWFDTRNFSKEPSTYNTKIKAIYILARDTDAMSVQAHVQGPLVVNKEMLLNLAYGQDWLVEDLDSLKDMINDIPVFSLKLPHGLNQLHKVVKALNYQGMI